ncbi:TetR/AcrR family transcriptional regulator [Streptomyces sp. NPDC091371]|uniref:TetR/AcrR family transcriptional regulator n=1 Tax=Streptomyces sp. NPDC091371 TaxID=3155303 RepID=UPI003436994A
MTRSEPNPSPRRQELLEAAYAYALRSGLGELSLRPLAEEIESSPRVLLYLFGSKDGLIRALLARARADELARVQQLADAQHGPDGLRAVARELWRWLADEAHRGLLTLWVESYARSLVDPDGPWAGFARDTVGDWLALLAAAQPAGVRDTEAALAQRTLVLAVLRGALLDLLATGDTARTTAAVHRHLDGCA